MYQYKGKEKVRLHFPSCQVQEVIFCMLYYLIFFHAIPLREKYIGRKVELASLYIRSVLDTLEQSV